MTTSEMIYAFKIGYDIANLEGPGYEDEEIIRFLNQAQEIEVMKEVAVRRWTYISNLIQNEVLSTVPVATYNYISTVSPSEPEEYISYVSSRSKVTRNTFKSTSGDEWLGNILIQKEQSSKYVSSSLNHIILIVPRVYEDEDRTLTVIYDRHTTLDGTNDFSLDYVRRPSDIAAGVDSIVNEVLHERIVNTAVDIAKKVWNPQEAGVSQQTDQLMDKPEM
jgi:hypothetical protein